MKTYLLCNPVRKKDLFHRSLSCVQSTNDVGNLSFFKCLLCPKTNMSLPALYSHYQRGHGEKISCEPQFVVEARYHKCQICSRATLCDNMTISKHLQNHNIKINECNKNYVLKNGGRVIYNFFEYLRNGHQIVQPEEKGLKKTMMPEITQNNLILPCDISSDSEDSDGED